MYAPIPSPMTKTAANPLASVLRWFSGPAGRRRLMTGAALVPSRMPKPTKGNLRRWFARQIYTTTGWLPGFGSMTAPQRTRTLQTIRAGVPGYQLDVADAQRALTKALAKGKKNLIPDLRRDLQTARAQLQLARMSRGGTILGTMGSLVSQPGKTVRLGWQASSRLNKGLTLGLMGYGAYGVATARPEDYRGPDALFKSRRGQVGSEILGNVGYLATGAMPLLPAFALSSGLGSVGEGLGNLLA